MSAALLLLQLAMTQLRSFTEATARTPSGPSSAAFLPTDTEISKATDTFPEKDKSLKTTHSIAELPEARRGQTE